MRDPTRLFPTTVALEFNSDFPKEHIGYFDWSNMKIKRNDDGTTRVGMANQFWRLFREEMVLQSKNKLNSDANTILMSKVELQVDKNIGHEKPPRVCFVWLHFTNYYF